MNATLGRMASFNKIKLGDAITFQRGFDITKSEQTEGEIPIVSSSGISSFHNQWKTKGPGVVIGRKGTLGTVHYLKGNFWPHDTTLWVKDFKGNNRRFTYFFLQTLHLENFDTGSSNPTLNRNHIHKIKIIFPKLDEQQKIAAILSAYDELIENNQRRIALLEKMAEEIYREWFVRMRFPENRETNFNKGLPSNWEICEIGDKFSTCLGGTPSRTESSYWGGEIPWINSGEVNKLRIIEPSEYITENGLRYSATKIMPKRTTVIAITGATLGQVSLTEIEVCANQSVVGVYDSTGIYSEYIYQFVRANIENLIAKQSGGGQQHINKDIVGKEKILLPPLNLIEKYNHVVRPIFNQIRTLLYSTQANTQMRDKLLPRLISGKLSVEHLDIRFPPGMEESACV